MREPDKSRTSAWWWRLRAACTALGRDRDGSVLFYTTLSLPVLVGFALLVIDGSRYMNLHSTVQHAADGLALTAAGELNGPGNPDALERAKLAVQTLIRNEQRFGSDESGAPLLTSDQLEIVCPSDEDCDVTGRFLTSLPPDDATPIDEWIAEDSSRLVANLSDNLVDHPRATKARFVEITVKPQNLSTLMPASFIGGNSAVAAQAAAVAGYTKGVCFFTPIMMCNPFEGQTPDLFASASEPAFRRRMIELRQVGPGADYGPGNFAFLRHDSMGPGANALRDALGKVDPGTCFNEDGVNTEPGQSMGPVQQGLNVRFDIYDGPMSSKKNDPDYRPSINVRKGYSSCQPPTQGGAGYQGLPRDNTIDTELGGGGRIYSGDWNFENYWEVNFGHAGITPPNDEDGVVWSDDNRPSRYEVYRHEIETDLASNPSQKLFNQSSAGGETGAPMCYTGGTLSDDPDRRIMHAAVVNCEAEGPLNGQEDDVPVYAFAKFFLIRPIEGADSIDVELVEVVDPPTDYQAKDTVQLFR